MPAGRLAHVSSHGLWPMGQAIWVPSSGPQFSVTSGQGRWGKLGLRWGIWRAGAIHPQQNQNQFHCGRKLVPGRTGQEVLA